MLLLDFEKAYDRIEWSFVNMMLECLGFPIHFNIMVNVLLKDAKVCVEINGSKSYSFDLPKSIR